MGAIASVRCSVTVGVIELNERAGRESLWGRLTLAIIMEMMCEPLHSDPWVIYTAHMKQMKLILIIYG